MKRYLDPILFLLISGCIIIPLMQIYRSDPYAEFASILRILITIISIMLFVIFFMRYISSIEKFSTMVVAATRNKKILFLLLLLTLQIINATVCYWIYYNNPKLYVLGDEIEKRHTEITKKKFENESLHVKAFDDMVNTDLKVLKYLKETQNSFHKSSDGSFLVNDSLYLVYEYPMSPPGGGDGPLIVKAYSKKELIHITTLYLARDEIKIAIQNEIDRLERKASLIRNDLIEINSRSSDFRWQYLHFLNYLFTEQLQPMSTILIIMSWLKCLVWIAISLLLSSKFWTKVDSGT